MIRIVIGKQLQISGKNLSRTSGYITLEFRIVLNRTITEVHRQPFILMGFDGAIQRKRTQELLGLFRYLAELRQRCAASASIQGKSNSKASHQSLRTLIIFSAISYVTDEFRYNNRFPTMPLSARSVRA